MTKIVVGTPGESISMVWKLHSFHSRFSIKFHKENPFNNFILPIAYFKNEFRGSIRNVPYLRKNKRCRIFCKFSKRNCVGKITIKKLKCYDKNVYTVKSSRGEFQSKKLELKGT